MYILMSWGTDKNYNKIDKSYFRNMIDLMGDEIIRSAQTTTIIPDTIVDGVITVPSTTTITNTLGNLSMHGDLNCLGVNNIVSDSSGNVLSTALYGGTINCKKININTQYFGVVNVETEMRNISNSLQGYAEKDSPVFETQITTPKIILDGTDLQTQINNIQLTPGIQGEQGIHGSLINRAG